MCFLRKNIVMVYNILIAGAGQIGSRHLQSLKKTNLKSRIFVYDISTESLKVARERYNQIPGGEQIEEIEFADSLEGVMPEIDFAVIATGSKGRAQIIRSLTEVCRVRYMLIEKVLFQSLPEYGQVMELLGKKGIQAWVNCPRRMNPFYKDLAGKLVNEKLSVTVEGTQWGIGCNTIHFIDFVSFLTGCNEYVLEEHLEPEILDSKRAGYLEFTGEISLSWANGTKCRIVSHREGEYFPPVILVVCESLRMLIDENEGEIFVARKSDNWEWVNEKFRIKFQSELTSEVFEGLMLHQSCDLTPYTESVQLHKPFIEMLLGFLDRNYQSGIKSCPVT